VKMPNVVKDLSGPESVKIRPRFEAFLHGQVLDVGAGEKAITEGAVSIDLRDQFGSRQGLAIKAHGEYLPFRDEAFDTVVNSHNLEHMPNDFTAMSEMWRVLKRGGYLLLYLPMKGLFPSHTVYPAHYRDYEPENVVGMLDHLVVEYELLDCSILNAVREFSFCMVVRKIK